MILLTACKPPARTDVECKPMSEPEIITEARKAVDEEGDDAGRMLAQLFLNAVKSGMTQDEVLRALGTSRWVKDCSFTQFRKGVVPVRTMIGDGDQRQQISVIGLDFYIRDGKDRERWGAWIGLSNFTGSIIANQGSIWYAWAIAKHETADSSGTYNQFTNGLANGGVGAHGQRGEPYYASSEGDGWGLFQRDSSSGHPVTTEETWSWDGNMMGFLQNEYPEHLTIANNYVDSVQRNNVSTFEEPQFTIKGRSISGRDVLALTWYNGPQGRSNSRLLHFDPTQPSGQRWSLDLPNAPSKNQPYVYEIINQYNGG